MADNSYHVLKTLDNPPRILFWDVYEFLAIAVPFVVGMGVASIAIMLSGIPLKILYKKFKKKSPYISFSQRVYWYLPKNKKLKNIPPSHQREFIL